MKNPTTLDINRIIRTATILAVSSQAQFSEAPGRGATRAGVVLRSLDRSAIVCESPHRRIASRATTSELLSKVGDAGFRRRVRLAFLRP